MTWRKLRVRSLYSAVIRVAERPGGVAEGWIYGDAPLLMEPFGAEAQEIFFLATAYHALSCVLWTQVCFSKSSCATRLNASAATVLSRRGVVMPHVQREQHQPLKSSPSTRIKCLFIHLPLRAFGFELGRGGMEDFDAV
jgi:hypothetical protein